MDDHLLEIKATVYDNIGLSISSYKMEIESAEYNACQFKLNQKLIICRTAKITPKKIGQFVTFWKRNKNEPIEPLNETDELDFYVINVMKGNLLGQFVLPKSILIKKGIISTLKKEGKRGFRVYPNWDEPKSRQAILTQNWQLKYFYEIKKSTNFKLALELYNAQ